jgi:FemAB-related protein (PEP-CTERM system-associated)
MHLKMLKELDIVKVKKLSKVKAKAWDRYVGLNLGGTFFHLSGWMKVLKETFGYEPCYLYAESDGQICGILPLFYVNNILSGKALVSLPFGVYGGVCADDDYIGDCLIEEAMKLTRQMGAKYLELRHLDKPRKDLPVKELYSTFIKELPLKVEDCLQELPRKTRAAARKSISFSLRAEYGACYLKDFYNVYAVSMRNLGSPVFSYFYLENLLKEFKGNVIVTRIRYKNRTIAGVFSFRYKDTLIPYYGGALSSASKYQPNNFMYLKLMEYGVEQGMRYFDFGRSKKGTGSYHFKELHGFIPQLLYYQYYLNAVDKIPDISPKNPKLALAIKVWQKMPVWMTKIVGPVVSRLTPP